MFRKYHDNGNIEWKPASSTLACMKLLFPNGPYEVFKCDNQEESVIEVCRGHKFFISSFTDYDGTVHGYLMDYFPGESMKVVGLTDFYDRKTVFWNKNKESWEVVDGLPELPI